MTYATLANLTDRFGADMLIGLTDRAQPASGQIGVPTVERALKDADAMIDGYIAGRYALPLNEVPPQIIDIAQMLAIWKLHTYKPDEKIEIDYREALKSLRDISDGKITLNLPSNATPTTVDGGGAQLTDRERPLTAANLKGYI